MEVFAIALDWVQTLAPAAFTAMVGYVAASRKKRTERQIERDRARKEMDDKFSAKQDAIANGLQSILRQHLLDAYECYYTRKVPMSSERFHQLNSQYDAYKALDGNGVVDQTWDKLKEISIHVEANSTIPN